MSLRQWGKHLGPSEKVTSLSFHRKGNFQDAGMKGLHLWPQVRFLGCAHWWSLVSAWNCLDGRVFGSHTQQQKGESNMHAHTWGRWKEKQKAALSVGHSSPSYHKGREFDNVTTTNVGWCHLRMASSSIIKFRTSYSVCST